jgi:hypothetical protein
MNDTPYKVVWLQDQSDTIFAPMPIDLRRWVQVGMAVKVFGCLVGSTRKEHFWITVTQRDGDNLTGIVSSHLCWNRVTGQTITFQMRHIVSNPIIWPPFATKVCEVQICCMHNDEDGGRLADSEQPMLEVNGYDVLVRFCDVNDNPEEPEDIIHFKEFCFDDYADAGIFADYLADKYTPGFEPEAI